MTGVDPLTRFAPGAVATGPEGARRIDVVFAGPSHLWQLVYSEPGGWTPHWRRRGGSYESSVTVCAFSGGRLDTFGLGHDGDLYHAWALGDQLDDPGEWPAESVGHPDGRTITSSPAAVATGPTGLVAAVRTVRDADHAPGLWFAELEPAGPAGPARWRWHTRPIGGWPVTEHGLASAPGLTWRMPGSLDLAVVGGDSYLHHTVSPGAWEVLRGHHNGTLTSSPSLTFWHESEHPDLSAVHIAVCFGPTPILPGAVALKSWLGRHWTDQELIYINGDTDGRGVQGPPALTSWGKPRLDAFFLTAADIVGSDLRLTHGWRNSARDGWTFEQLPAPPLT